MKAETNYRTRIVLDNGASLEILKHNLNKKQEEFSIKEIELILKMLEA